MYTIIWHEYREHGAVAENGRERMISVSKSTQTLIFQFLCIHCGVQEVNLNISQQIIKFINIKIITFSTRPQPKQ